MRKFSGYCEIVFTRVYTQTNKYKLLPFTIESFSHYKCDKNYSVARADLDVFIVLYTISGEGELEYLGNKYRVGKNQVIFINSRLYHKYKSANGEPWEFYFMLIGGVGVKSYYDTMFSEKYYVLDFFDEVIIKKFIDTMLMIDEKQLHQFELLACKHINDLLLQIAFLNSGFENSELSESIDYIEENFDKAISIDELAKIANMSKCHYIRKFKNIYHETPYTYITRIKINKARQFLLSTENTVDEISKLVGFNDSVTFIRSFKKVTGTTPNGYRKSNLNQ